LLWSVAAVALFTVVSPFLDGFAVIFGFVPMTGGQMAASAAIVLGYLVSTEVAKAVMFRHATR